jgi:hypothetical protein
MFEFIVGFIIGFIIVRIFIAYQRYKMQVLNEEVVGTLRGMVKQIEDNIVPLHLRMEQGILYAYNAETNEFIAQGSDLDMLRINFTSNIKNKKGVVVSSDENCQYLIKEYAERNNVKIAVTKNGDNL